MLRVLWLATLALSLPAALGAAIVALVLVTSPKVSSTAASPTGRVLAASAQIYEPQSGDNSSVSGQAIAADARALIIRNYLHQYDSPLEPHAQDLIDIGDKYGLDPNLLVAIAQQESNLCKKIPADSHNCWGFGIYGDKVTRFASYPEAIDTVASTLKNKYINQGLDTPEKIMTRYTPSSVDLGGPWAIGVNQFLEELQ